MFKWTGGPPVVVDTLMSCCCFYRKNEESINFGEREREGKEGRKEGREGRYNMYFKFQRNMVCYFHKTQNNATYL